ncbi:MAG TPA: hypothetical protein VFA89_02340 [Terriglobales bacterium]|nr:hypothetical protein [Terriglobales bacterium]
MNHQALANHAFRVVRAHHQFRFIVIADPGIYRWLGIKVVTSPAAWAGTPTREAAHDFVVLDANLDSQRRIMQEFMVVARARTQKAIKPVCLVNGAWKAIQN